MRTPGPWNPQPGAPTYGAHNRPAPNSAYSQLNNNQSSVNWAEEMNRIRWEQLVELGMVEGHDEMAQDEEIQRSSRDLIQGDIGGAGGAGQGGGYGAPPGAPGATMPGQVDTSRLAAMGNFTPPPLPAAPSWSAAAPPPERIAPFDPNSLGAPPPLEQAPDGPARINASQFGQPTAMPNLRRPQHPPRPLPPRV